MNIRLATTEDEINIKAFGDTEWAEADKDHFGDTSVDFNRKKFIFIAELDSQIAGYVKIETDMGVCKIDSIITGSGFRGKGVGKLLMEKAEEIAKSEVCHKVILETGIDWEARKFYELCGYVVSATLTDHFGHKDFVLMEKFI